MIYLGDDTRMALAILAMAVIDWLWGLAFWWIRR
jgi:hypothetical protein